MTSTAQAPAIRIERIGAFLLVTFNQPEQRNPLGPEVVAGLYQALDTAEADAGIRALAIRGAGPVFCAGGNLGNFADRLAAPPDTDGGDPIASSNRTFGTFLERLVRFPKPVVVAAHGAAMGGGAGLVCAADLVIAAESAKFLSGATRSGMAPDGGSTVTLARIIGFRKAMELLLTNRVIDAKEALEIGLLTKVVPDDQLWTASFALAQELADGAPQALAATKRMLWNGIGLSVEAALPEESRTVSALSGTADCREALAAIIEKRKPNFTGK